MDYRVLITDVDGTLIGRDGSIPAENREALAEARSRGVLVALSTGRVPHACQEIIRELELEGSYHIFFDGALVGNYDQSQQLYVQPLSREIIIEAVEYARREDIYLEFYSATRFFIERENWASEVHRRFFNLDPVITDLKSLPDRELIIKGELMTASAEEEAQAKNFQRHFQGRLRLSGARTPAHPGIDFINVVDPGVSKGKALARLLSHLGVPPAEVMAVGDSGNDISLFKGVGLAVAMAHAPDEVKAAAHHVTLDIDHAGLAAAINEYLLR